MIVGKEYKFSAAHFLEGHPTCGRMHGHTYTVTIEIDAAINIYGFVIDFKELNGVVELLLKDFDHNCLNNLLFLTTCESIASNLLHNLLEIIPGHVLNFKSLSVQVREGEGGYARAMYSL